MYQEECLWDYEGSEVFFPHGNKVSKSKKTLKFLLIMQLLNNIFHLLSFYLHMKVWQLVFFTYLWTGYFLNLLFCFPLVLTGIEIKVMKWRKDLQSTEGHDEIFFPGLWHIFILYFFLYQHLVRGVKEKIFHCFHILNVC